MTAAAPGNRRPGWRFLLLWLAATFLGGLLYAFPVAAVQTAARGAAASAGIPESGGPLTWLAVATAVLCGAAMGGTIGLAQWLLLRTEARGTGAWGAATLAGYAALGLIPLAVGTTQPAWVNWALTLIINGKPHWLARVDPSWTAASWPAGAVTLTLFGVVLGLMQWFVLRGHARHAGWWVAISAAGWALAAGLSLAPAIGIVASWLAPALASGVGLVWLRRRGIA